MKKVYFLMTGLSILLSLAGCSSQAPAETNLQPREIAEAIAKSQTTLPELNQITSSDDDFALYLSDYDLSDSQVEDGIICYADGVEASEIAVLMMTDEKAADDAQAALSEYIKERAGVFEGYAPEQAAIAENGTALTNGRYTALLICPDISAAKASFTGCFESGPAQTSPAATTEARFTETTGSGYAGAAKDSYDAASVLQAWRSGDETQLSEINLTILQAAKEVIRQEIDSTMTDYEKELAIHDWITNWSSFDYRVFGRGSSGGTDAASETPYGVLIDRSAMCHGYSSTFQLFMDMLNIECITVYGTPSSSGVSHSWNMVRLDGEWYCVDTAWDDPIGGSPSHSYFNVTNQFLKNGGIHRWDETEVPAATATTYSFKY